MCSGARRATAARRPRRGHRDRGVPRDPCRVPARVRVRRPRVAIGAGAGCRLGRRALDPGAPRGGCPRVACDVDPRGWPRPAPSPWRSRGARDAVRRARALRDRGRAERRDDPPLACARGGGSRQQPARDAAGRRPTPGPRHRVRTRLRRQRRRRDLARGLRDARLGRRPHAGAVGGDRGDARRRVRERRSEAASRRPRQRIVSLFGREVEGSEGRGVDWGSISAVVRRAGGHRRIVRPAVRLPAARSSNPAPVSHSSTWVRSG